MYLKLYTDFYVEEDYIKKGLTRETILHYDTEVAMINNNGHNIIIIDRYYNDKHYEPSEQMPNAEGRRGLKLILF